MIAKRATSNEPFYTTMIDIVTFSKALADQTRQQIMHELCCEWLTASDLVERIGVSQPTISHHLAILSAANLLNKRREGKLVYCSLNQAIVTECCGRLMLQFAPTMQTTES